MTAETADSTTEKRGEENDAVAGGTKEKGEHAARAAGILRATRPYLPLTCLQTLALVVLLAVLSTHAPFRRSLLRPLLRNLYKFTMTIIGTAIGVAVGLGFATHVYDALDTLSPHNNITERKHALEAAPRSSPSKWHPDHRISSNSMAGQPLEDNENSYAALMASAGYAIPAGLLQRGQILRPSNNPPSSSTHYDNSSRSSLYRFADSYNSGVPPISNPHQKGHVLMKRMWPNLPPNVNYQLGLLIEFVLRDYISCWYASVDEGVLYQDEKEKRAAAATTTTTEVKEEQEKKRASMTLTTTPLRTSPFMEILYTSFATILGNFATCAGENVNVADLFLVKFLKILSVNIKVYRELRCVALQKKKRNHASYPKDHRVQARVRHASVGSIIPVAAGKDLTATTTTGKPANAIGGKRSGMKSVVAGGVGSVPNANTGAIFGNYNSSGSSVVNSSASCTESGEGGNTAAVVTDRSISPAEPATSAGGMFDSFIHSPDINRTNGSNVSQATVTTNANTTTNTPQTFTREDVSEVAMVREYLLAGKLHRAVTFGLDVPSLLFADPLGRDCPPPSTHNDTMTEDEVLHARLFSPQSRILYECELDYNRLLSHRLCRILFPRSDFSSPIVRSCSVEMFAACVLTPVMGCFVPDFLNWGIVEGLKGSVDNCNDEKGEKQNNDTLAADDCGDRLAVKTSTRSERFPGNTDALLNKTESDDEGDNYADDDANATTEEDEEGEGALDVDDDDVSAIVDLEDAELDAVVGQRAAVTAIDEDELSLTPSIENGEHGGILSAPNKRGTEFLTDTGDVPGSAPVKVSTRKDDAEHILPLLTMAVIDLQSFVDFDDARLARGRMEHVEVDWYKHGCREAVQQLLLVVEAALLHGMLPHRRKKKKRVGTVVICATQNGDKGKSLSVNDGGEDIKSNIRRNKFARENEGEEHESVELDIGDPIPEDAAHLESKSLSVVLMEMTGDLISFERRVEVEETRENDPSSMYEVGEEDEESIDLLPKAQGNEISTLRTLIAAWLHTGQVFRVLSVFVRSKTTILYPFYHKDAFVRDSRSAAGFSRQLKSLDGVDIMVDTMYVLASPCLDLTRMSFLDGEEDDVSGSDHGATDSRKPASSGSFANPTFTASAMTKSRAHNTHAMASNARIGASTKGLASEAAASFRGKGRNLFIQQSQNEKVISLGGSIKANFQSNRKRLSRLVGGGGEEGSVGPMGPISGLSLTRQRSVSAGMSIEVVAPHSLSASAHSSSHGDLSPRPLRTTLGSSAVVGHLHGYCTPAYLEFHKNESFATSLRLERERRMQSWYSATNQDSTSDNRATIDMVCRSRGLTERDLLVHRELHHLARNFYSNTNILGLRYAMPRNIEKPLSSDSNSTEEKDSKEGNLGPDNIQEFLAPTSLLTMETISARRRIEVPDDDSSFLLRAQPRPLNPVGVHRDQRNHDLSYKCYAAVYEDPIAHPQSDRYRGGRCVRHCLLRYFPSDRTATITAMHDSRKLDHRKTKGEGRSDLPPGSLLSRDPSFLSKEFQKERHLCQKSHAKGSERAGGPLSTALLVSTVIEPTDFNSLPRTGKALDFVYRFCLFEKPQVELGGKKFTVQDSALLGPHRADASSLEISDASLSVALLMFDSEGGNVVSDGDISSIPSDFNRARPVIASGKGGKLVSDDEGKLGGFKMERGSDGAPMVLMKLSDDKNQLKDGTSGGQVSVEVRPYRSSFVRAALMVTSARNEAQLQCLLMCVKSGSARNATKSRTEALLQPTLSLLDFATSKKREKQSTLLRDLKLGINHIDRDQLRRNGLLNPRHPTRLRGLKVTVEDIVQTKVTHNVNLLESPTLLVYKIRCVAIAELVELRSDDNTGYGSPAVDGRKPKCGDLFREEWVVLRPFRDFSTLHKHLKSQVSPSESSAGAGAKIVGAATGLATAALSIGSGIAGVQRQRQALVPSLGQATKAGALGITKKGNERRRELLNSYLNYLLDPKHLLNRCPELLRFVGAYDPLPPEVKTGGGIMENLKDSLERLEIKRNLVNRNNLDAIVPRSVPVPSASDTAGTLASVLTNVASQDTSHESHSSDQGLGIISARAKLMSEKLKKLSGAQIAMRAAIQTKIERVKLTTVRNTVFELIRHQFDLDNASFFRSRMIAALKTMSFAITSAQEFNNTLLDAHMKYVNGKSLSEYIKLLTDTIWPNGVLYESSPESTTEEKKELETKSKAMLHQAFPDQLKTVLGQEISQDGVNILHEMLQNRVVLKSIAYMLMDEVWQEVFPELSGVVTGAQVLETNA